MGAGVLPEATIGLDYVCVDVMLMVFTCLASCCAPRMLSCKLLCNNRSTAHFEGARCNVQQAPVCFACSVSQ